MLTSYFSLLLCQFNVTFITSKNTGCQKREKIRTNLEAKVVVERGDTRLSAGEIIQTQ